MTQETVAPVERPLLTGLEHLRQRWWVLLLLGIGLIVIGMIAIVEAYFFTDALIFWFGILFLAGAILQVVSALMARRWRGFFVHLLTAILYLVAGVLMIHHPGKAAAVLTLMIAAVLLVGGVLRIVISMIERFPHWGWVLLNGIVTFWLGALILEQWPDSGEWVIGLFVGIEMLFAGWSSVMLALGIRSLPSQPA
jgi:uncharacterized membrane protein HdeD (DUF308 family)